MLFIRRKVKVTIIPASTILSNENEMKYYLFSKMKNIDKGKQ